MQKNRPPLGPNSAKKGMAVNFVCANGLPQSTSGKINVAGGAPIMTRTMTVNDQILAKNSQQNRQEDLAETIEAQYAKMKTQVGQG